jgi:hypothetical protein
MEMMHTLVYFFTIIIQLMVTDNTGQHSYLSLQTKYLTILPQNAGKHVYKALKGQFINHNILTLLMNMLLLN